VRKMEVRGALEGNCRSLRYYASVGMTKGRAVIRLRVGQSDGRT
jgi:hypothetical protein